MEGRIIFKNVAAKTKIVVNAICVYNEVFTPYLDVILFTNGEYTETKSIDLDSIAKNEDGTCDEEALATVLKETVGSDCKEISICLNSDRVFKVTNSYPKVSKGKLASLYKDDFKVFYGESKDKYITILENYFGDNKTLAYTYFVPVDLKNYFARVAKLANLKLANINLLADYILNLIRQGHVQEDLMIVYEHHNHEMIISSYSGILSGFNEFEFSDSDIENKIYLCESRHLYDLEEKKIENVYTNAESLLEKEERIKLEEIKFKYDLLKGKIV